MLSSRGKIVLKPFKNTRTLFCTSKIVLSPFRRRTLDIKSKIVLSPFRRKSRDKIVLTPFKRRKSLNIKNLKE